MSIVILAAGVACMVFVGYFIVKGFNPVGVLLVGAMMLMLISIILGIDIMPKGVKGTQVGILDIFEVIRTTLSGRAGGLGLTIMVLCGFGVYMSEIKANLVVVKLASKPLYYIKNPFILMPLAYVIGSLMGLAVSSATGLGVLLMTTLFPIMTALGISAEATISLCVLATGMSLSPAGSDMIIAAKMSNLSPLTYTFAYSLPVSIMGMIVIAISNVFWQRHCDKKEGVKKVEIEAKKLEVNAPSIYIILPFLPIVGVCLFSGNISGLPHLHIVTIALISIAIGAVCEGFRTRSFKEVLDGLTSCYKAMGEAFSSVVLLLVAAGLFANALKSIGFIAIILGFATGSGAGTIALMIILVIITILAAVATGSGNAAFYAFVELIPKLASELGANPAFLIIPMQQASTLARAMSPVSGVVVATSSMAKISPLSIVKRTSVPILLGTLAMIVADILLVPIAAM